MQDGKIESIGTYDDLKRKGLNFAAVIEAHRLHNQELATQAAEES